MPLSAAGDGGGDAGEGREVGEGPYRALGVNGLAVISGSDVALSNGSATRVVRGHVVFLGVFVSNKAQRCHFSGHGLNPDAVAALFTNTR